MTGRVLAQALVMASGGLLSFGSILLTLMLLSCDGGLRKALAYWAGYFGCYVVIGLSVLALGQSAVSSVGDNAPVATSWLWVALALVMYAIAFKTWRASDDRPSRLPQLLSRVDGAAAGKVFLVGGTVAVVNVKNLAIYLSAVAIVADAPLPFSAGAAAVVAVAAVFCVSVLAPILIFAIGRQRAQPALAALRRRLQTGSRKLTLAVLMVFGSLFMIRGLGG